MFKLTSVTSKIGQGHPSSNLTKTLLKYIHGISLGPMRLIFLLSYRVYKRKLQIFMFKLTPVTSKIGQGHPSSNLTKTLLRYIHGISLGPMRLIFVKLSCLQAKIANLKNRSRSSIFELNQDTPEIHPWYKFRPNALIFVKLSCLQAKIANVHV